MIKKYSYWLVFLIILILCVGYYLEIQVSKINKIETSAKDESLLIYHWGEIPKFNPINPDGLYVWWLQNLVWDRLINIDVFKQWKPHLAENWSFNKDKSKLILRLPEDLVWSNGRRVEEKDFEFSLNYHKDQNFIGAIYSPLLSRIRLVSFENNELVFALNENGYGDPRYASQVYWSEVLSVFRLYPYDLKKQPYVGTGAYTVDSFSSTKAWGLNKNKKSWFWKRYEQREFVDHLRVKSVISNSLLTRIISKTDALVIGVDLFQKGIREWHPLDEKTYATSIVFNQNKVDIDFRKKIIRMLNQVNDLEKLNLNLKGFSSELRKPENVQLDRFDGAAESSKLSVLYTSSLDQVWLVYLQEKLKKLGLELELLKVSETNLNDRIINKDFVSYVNTHSIDDFYPQYLSYHSKGSYNYFGWNNEKMDHLLTRILDQSSREEMEQLRVEFRMLMDQELSEAPMYTYKSSMLWTRKPCKPTKSQFQGLGLIYKGIVCADNL